MFQKMKEKMLRAHTRVMMHDLRGGQGITEYAILAGLIVVAAVVLIITFSGQIQTLWTDATNSMADIITQSESHG